MLQLAPFRNRTNFGRFLNERKLTGTAVEIGTHRGTFANAFLTHWKGHYLYCIDPWATPPGYEGQAETLRTLVGGAETREEDMNEAEAIASFHSPRMVLIQKTSHDAFRTSDRAQFDFIYIDGDHRAEMVKWDIEHWWLRVKPGGILAGHDFLCINENNGGWGREIQPVVMKFAEQEQVDVWMILEEDNLPWSFYLEKP
jgi:hypothetical protein